MALGYKLFLGFRCLFGLVVMILSRRYDHVWLLRMFLRVGGEGMCRGEEALVRFVIEVFVFNRLADMVLCCRLFDLFSLICFIYL